jgi:nucleotide-binding universal stress UspA family protein
MLVVGYDGTEGARAALRHAIGFARDLGTGILAVFVYERSALATEMRDLDAAVALRAREVLEEARAIAEADGVAFSSEVAEGRIAEALVAAADAHDARAVVVGSYGEGPLRSALLGATPHRLLHICERPVLVVRT